MRIASGSAYHSLHILRFAHYLRAIVLKDECWGGIFRVRHLKAAVGTAPLPPAFASSAQQMSSSRTDGKLGGAAFEDSDVDARTQNGVPSVRTDAPLRGAVIVHARSLSRALCLFDVAVSDGGTTKAVVNGPVRGQQKDKRVRRAVLCLRTLSCVVEPWAKPLLHATPL